MRYGIICSDVSTEFMLYTMSNHRLPKQSDKNALFSHALYLCQIIGFQNRIPVPTIAKNGFVPMSNHRLPKLTFVDSPL